MRDPRLQNFSWETPQETLFKQGRGAALLLQQQQEALADQNWLGAIEATDALLQAVDSLAQLQPAGAARFWLDLAEALAALTASLHPLLHLESEQPLPEPQRSECCWQLAALLDQALMTPAVLPEWVGVMHTQLLLHGAIYWRDRQQADAEVEGEDAVLAAERAARLFGRAAHRLDPVPEWVSLACQDYGVSPIDDPRCDSRPLEVAESPPDSPDEEPLTTASHHSRLWPPSQLEEELDHWLFDLRPPRRVRIGLACVPGAPLLCREGPRADLNLAALLQDPSGVAVDPWFEAVLAPLRRAQEAGQLEQIELLEPFSSLYASLAHHWLQGGELTSGQRARIPALLHTWNRLLGPAQLRAQRTPGSLIASEDEASAEAAALLQVVPDPLEIAALAACVAQPRAHAASGADEAAAIEAALAELRRRHHDSQFWQAPAPSGLDVREALRLLQRDAGFYAAAGDAMACLERWRDDALDGLSRAQIRCTGGPDDEALLLELAQLTAHHAGRLPSLRSSLSLADLLSRMAGREILYVGWSAAEVLDQHRSGRAFRLFRDRMILPYGLRVVPMPDSRHPLRPHRGFSDSLDQLIGAVEAEHAARPLDLLLVDQGAYRLPLLSAIERRQGIPACAPGPGVLQLFGLDRPGVTPWREQQRDPAMWRPLP